MSRTRARSTSANMSSGSVCGGTIQPAATHASKDPRSTRARTRNSSILIISSLQMPAWVLVFARLPPLDERFELGICRLRQDDFQRHIFIAMAAVAARRALAFE